MRWELGFLNAYVVVGGSDIRHQLSSWLTSADVEIFFAGGLRSLLGCAIPSDLTTCHYAFRSARARAWPKVFLQSSSFGLFSLWWLSVLGDMIPPSLQQPVATQIRCLLDLGQMTANILTVMAVTTYALRIRLGSHSSAYWLGP